MSSGTIIKAARTIRAGGVVAYPTEAVFGLGCDPLNEIAVRRVLELKQRPVEKGLILIAAEFSQLEPYLQPVGSNIHNRILESWPGPITWLLPARRWVSRTLRGRHSTIAVRITAHPSAAKLCRAVGSAIVSTSANRAGQPPCRSVEQLIEAFSDGIDFILDAPLGLATAPSEIRDAISGRIIRPGR